MLNRWHTLSTATKVALLGALIGLVGVTLALIDKL
jgi:hypothetical protein